MATINEILFEESVSHQHDLNSYGNGAVRRLIAILNRSDDDLFNKLRIALEKMDPDTFTIQRLERLLASVRELNEQAYQKFTEGLETDLQGVTKAESTYQFDLFREVIPVKLNIAQVVPDHVYAAAIARPFQGRILKEWAAGMEAARMTRIRDEVRMGFIANETIDQIVQRIRGTRAFGYTDGIITIDRRSAEAVVRTAINHTANYARDQFYQRNDTLLKGVRLVETLDPRTCLQCMALDGKVYQMGKGPRPPHHFGCRGTSTPVIKSFRELGLDADELPESTRASMDGQVPADMNYQQWLEKQSAARQNEILGPARARMFRNGAPITSFVNRAGHELTLADLAKTKVGRTTLNA